MVTFSGVNNGAHKTCKASFLAPCGISSPFKGFPPCISNEAITYFLYFFFLDL